MKKNAVVPLVSIMMCSSPLFRIKNAKTYPRTHFAPDQKWYWPSRHDGFGWRFADELRTHALATEDGLYMHVALSPRFFCRLSYAVQGRIRANFGATEKQNEKKNT